MAKQSCDFTGERIGKRLVARDNRTGRKVVVQRHGKKFSCSRKKGRYSARSYAEAFLKCVA